MKLKLYKTNTLIGNCILTVLMLFSIAHMNAQSINTTVASSINNVFSPLEKNRVPYNILLDYGIEFIDISKYDGVLLSDNYSSISMYGEMYNTLVSSATATGVSGLVSPTLENAEWQTLQQQQNNTYKGSATASLILSGLYYNYSRIRTDALSTNKIQVINGQYDDKYIGGVWQNPYESKIAFAMTAPVQDIHQPTVAISLPAALWHTNETINNIDVDLGNGNGYKTLNNGATATETYTSVGLYTWTYRVQLSNGQYKYCRQKVNITVADSGGQARNSGCGNVQTLPPINATRAYLGVLGSARVQIAYGSTDCKLRKPLIVVEGLDTGFFAASGSIGDSDIETFFGYVRRSGSDDLEDLITNNTSIDYDVVYVNWDNGTDYLQRNAYVLQAVINYVNQLKANNGSTEPNVVLGQSMGGVIARYALRDMENRSETHDTSLFISHDAPHQGANVPLGFLYMARHAVDQFIRTPLGNIDIEISSGNIGLGSVKDLLDAPGVRQMLINNVNSSFALDPNLHVTWQNELKTMGYPQQTRNVALSNASHCASPQDVLAGDRIFTLDAFGKTSFLGDIALSLSGLYTSILPSILLDEAGFLLGLLPGTSKFDMDFWVNAYPATGTAQIYYGRLKYTKTLLWLIPINVTITERSFDSPLGTLPFDSYPGGVNPSFAGIDINAFESGLLGKFGFTVDLNPNFDFIPAASALDVGSNNTTLTNPDYLKVYTVSSPPTGNKAIPFDNFTTSYNTSSINEPHISFNTRNGNWLAEELDGDANTGFFDCSFVCSNASNIINGYGALCTYGVYSVNIPSGVSVNWSVNNTSTVSLSSSTGSSTTVTATGSADVILSANISSMDCGSITLTKNIKVGPPNSVTKLIHVSPFGCTMGEIFAKLAWGADQYEWQVTGGIIVENGGTTYIGGDAIFVDPYDTLNSFTIKVRTINSCGYSSWYTKTIPMQCDGGPTPLFTDPKPKGNNKRDAYTVYPNPSKDIVTIDLNKGYKPIEKNTAITGELFDMLGTSKFSLKIQNNTASFSVSHLTTGIYFLKIYLNDRIESHRLIIK